MHKSVLESEELNQRLHWLIFHTSNFCNTIVFTFLAFINLIVLRFFGLEVLEKAGIIFAVIVLLSVSHAYICSTGECTCGRTAKLQFLQKHSPIATMVWIFIFWTIFSAGAIVTATLASEPPYWLAAFALPYLSFILANSERRLEDNMRLAADAFLTSDKLADMTIKELKQLKRLANDLLETHNAKVIQAQIESKQRLIETIETYSVSLEQSRVAHLERQADD